MENEQRNDPEYHAARKRVEARMGFYVHLAVYVVVNAILVTINLVKSDSPADWWFYWPLLGWGIGIAFHAFKVFGNRGGDSLKERWVERETEKEMHRRQGT
ncbi:MAG: 2TM domain-containing protein [Planctomycetaceae bacterium]